jgi:copper chaperone CopZ
MEKKLVLDIKGLKCMGCVANVEQATRGLRGVKFATADLASSQAIVVIDPAEVTIGEVLAAIKKSGYEASEAA